MLTVAYRLYTRFLRHRVLAAPLPRHVALVMDGNRRWARERGFDNPSVGHKHGAEHVDDLLAWCADLRITHVTVFVASADNLRKRASGEVGYLMELVETVVAGRLTDPAHRWRLHLAGRLDLLPDATRHALKTARASTALREHGLHVTIAIGYDGREEVVDAIRALLDDAAAGGVAIEDLAASLAADDIAAHLHTRGQPDPDLVIRTSGEQRMSGFLLWQAAYAELYFCEVYWPGFRHVDFLRALRSYGARQRRFGA